MDSDVKNKVEYIIAVISEFAAAHSLNTLQAYRYLERFKGLDFVSRFYNVEHTRNRRSYSLLPQERRGIGMILLLALLQMIRLAFRYDGSLPG